MNSLIILICVVLALVSIGNGENCKLSAQPPDPNTGCCGATIEDRNIPGLFANIGEYPWMGIVEYKQENKIKLLCNAVLISGRYALSAAQCFSANGAVQVPQPVSIRLGEYDKGNEGKDCVNHDGDGLYCNDGAISVPIENIIVHPDYNDNKHHHDIALIRLAETVNYTDFIQPICLPTSDVTSDGKSGLHMTVAGWGAINDTVPSTNILHRFRVPFVDLNACQAAYNTNDIKVKLGTGQLCAGAEGKGPCRGDSGGPLMFVKRGYTEVLGLVSLGPRSCGMAGLPDVYTKVFSYDEWIRNNIQE